MKKILAFLIALVLCLTCFTACGDKKNPDTNDDGSKPTSVLDVEDAAAYLKNMYKKLLVDNVTKTDFELVSQVMQGGVVYTVEWTVDNDAIKVVPDEANKQVTIDVDEESPAEVAYKLTATIKDPNGKTAQLVFELIVPLYVPKGVPQIVENPVAGVAYKLFFTQTANGEFRYFTGNMKGFYGESTTEDAEAVDVFVETSGKGYFMYFTDKDGKKQYITIALSDDGAHVNFVFQPEKPKTPFSLDAANKNAPYMTVVKEGANKDYHLGTYGTYVTFGTSDASKAATSYVAHLGTVVDPSKISDADKVAAEKESLTLESDEFFVATTINLTTKGKLHNTVAITWASNSKYAVVSGDKLTIKLPTATTKATITATLKSGKVTATKKFEITINKASAGDASSQPVVNKDYVIKLNQQTAGKVVYFAGAMDGYYYGTTEDLTAATKVKVEADGAGYQIYFMDGNTKTYLEIVRKYDEAQDKTFTNVVFSTKKAAKAWTWNGELKTYIYTVDDVSFFLGTRNDKTYTTISACETKYTSNFRIEFADPTTGETLGGSGNQGGNQGGNEGGNEGGSTTPVKPVAGKEYYMMMVQETAGKTIYFAGVMDGYYYGTTEDAASAVKVVWGTDGSLSFMNGSTKNYLDIVSKYDEAQDKTFNNVVFTTTKPATKWVWDDTLGTLTYKVGDITFFLGTRNDKSYVTFSACEVKYTDNFKALFVENAGSGNQGGNQGGNEGGNTGDGTISNIADLNAIGAAKEHNTYTTEKYTAKGVITEIKNTQYGNLYIEDTAGNKLYLYGLYKDGVRYDAMNPQPKVGDTITVSGIIGQYNNNPQMKDAELIELVAGSGNQGGNEGGNQGGNEGGNEGGTITGTTATLVSADLGLANAADFTSTTIGGIITISADKATGSNPPKYYNSGSNIRIYTNNIFTVTAASGYKIVAIKIVASSEKAMMTDAITVSSGTQSHDTSSKTTTITGINASTFSFTNTKPTDVADSETKQVRIVSIEVTYAAV